MRTAHSHDAAARRCNLTRALENRDELARMAKRHALVEIEEELDGLRAGGQRRPHRRRRGRRIRREREPAGARTRRPRIEVDRVAIVGRQERVAGSRRARASPRAARTRARRRRRSAAPSDTMPSTSTR